MFICLFEGHTHRIPTHWPASRQLTPLLSTLKDRPKKLRIPLLLLVMFDPIPLRIPPRNDPRPKEHIPKKKHIPEISLVMPHPIVITVRMMGMMRRRRGDQPLKHP